MGDPERAEAITGFIKNINDTVMHFGLVDIIFVILVFIGLIRGYRKGFSVLLGNLIHIVFVISVTLEYLEPITSIFKAESAIFSAIVRALTFIAIAIVCHYVAKAILQGLAKIFTIQFTDLIDKVVGAFTGVLFFILVFSFIIHFMLMFSTQSFRRTFKEANMVGAFLEKTAPAVHGGVRGVILAVVGKVSDVKNSASTPQTDTAPAQVVYGT